MKAPAWRKAFWFILACVIFIFFTGAVDYWIFRFFEGPDALYNYWIAIGLTFASFGACMATAMWISNPRTKPEILLGVFATPFLLLISGIWDWVIYIFYIRYGSPYPDYAIWSAQYRWLGFWNTELQVLWTIACLIGIACMWLKLTKLKW